MVAVVILALIPPSPFCVPLAVAASNEKSALLGVLADEYEKRRPPVDGRCVDVQIFRVPSGEAEAALARGWDALSDGAPEPDVWSPAATTWVKLLEFDRAAAGLPKIVPPATPSIIQSPLVIAMPKPMAVAMATDVPSLQEIRDRIDRRIARAAGRYEIANEGVEARILDVEHALADARGDQLLDEIRQKVLAHPDENRPREG